MLNSAAVPGACKVGRLAGKVVVVTGAARGIGFAIGERFLAEGARLVLNDCDARELKTAAGKLEKSGEIVISAGDVSLSSGARKAMDTAWKRYGRLDALVNNAGISGSAAGDGPVTEAGESAWDRILRVNLRSVFLCCRWAIPRMQASGGGSIVNMSSVLALRGCSKHFKSHAYIASKGAIISLTRALAAYYAASGVRANVLCPGLVDTPLAGRVRARQDAMEYVAQRQYLTRGLISPRAVADAAVFLASDEAAAITGTIIPVDGGWTTGS